MTATVKTTSNSNVTKRPAAVIAAISLMFFLAIYPIIPDILLDILGPPAFEIRKEAIIVGTHAPIGALRAEYYTISAFALGQTGRLLSAVFLTVIAILIFLRRDAARFIYAALTICSLILTVSQPFINKVQLANCVVGFIVLALLFLQTSNRWFRHP